MKIDNAEVRKSQIDRINHIRATRDEKASWAALDALENAARTGKGNLLALSVDAAKLRCTVGEISYCLEQVYGRHVAKDSIVRGAYSKESMKSGDQGRIEYESALDNVQKFSKNEGRNPRILVAKMG